MDKLVQHVKIDMSGFPKQGLYCYGGVSFEANQVMQEPLEKLYKYENQPDMREKVREYISELDVEIDRCHKEISNLSYDEVQVRVNKAEINVYMSRAKTLMEVKNDLESRLEELI